jgi:uncharacterized protein (DUF433 family)
MRLNPPIAPGHNRTGKMGGHACTRGMRNTVLRVLEILARPIPIVRNCFADHPDLEEEDLRQALAFAAGQWHE